MYSAFPRPAELIHPSLSSDAAVESFGHAKSMILGVGGSPSIITRMFDGKSMDDRVQVRVLDSIARDSATRARLGSSP
jgi:hypothetical protein